MEEEVAKFIPCLILSCLQHTDTHFYFKDELSKLIESDMFELISDSVMHFYIAFDAEYKEIIENVFEDPTFMISKSRFLIKIGSRCLKLCDNPTFFNFLLMCAFVGRVLSFCYTNGKCYRVAENACKCAIAIFKRKFLELFNREGGLNGLQTYSDGLNTTVFNLQDYYHDLKDILCPDLSRKQLVLRLLENCRDVGSDEYFLTDFERKLLYKVTKKRLRKLKPNLDFLICRFPKNYFKMNQDSRCVIHNVVGSNLADIESNRRAENGPFLSLSSISEGTDSCLLPIDYTTKKNSESLNSNIPERQSELSNFRTIEKLSNCSVIEKPYEQSNCFNIGTKSESLDCCITDKRLEPSNCSTIGKPDMLKCCSIEDEIEPLNYCIAQKDFEPSIKDTTPEGSLSLVYHETSREEMHSENSETSNKKPTWSPKILKRSFSAMSMNSELSNKDDRIRSPDYLPVGTPSKTDASSEPKRLKISNFPEHKLALKTDFSSLQKPLFPHCCNLSQKSIYMPFSISAFENEPSYTKICSFEMEAELSKKDVSQFQIPAGEDRCIQNYSSTTSSNRNSLPLELKTEAIFPSASTDSLQKTLVNIPYLPREQHSAKVHQDKPSLETQVEMALASYSSEHHHEKHYQIPLSSSSSESSSGIQRSSEGYYTSESDISDESEEVEVQCYFPPFHSSQMYCTDSSPSESEYITADWEGDTTLKSLMRHKCFYCGTKCFNYIMHVFQQFTSHFID